MTLFTPLSSVFIIVVFSSLILLGVRKSLTIELNKCIENATAIQIKHRKLTHKLISLNPIAKKLRFSRKSAEIAYKIAPLNLKPAALVALKAIKVSQKIFRAKQLYLIKKARFLSLRSNAIFIKNQFIPIKPSAGLEVEKIQKKSDSPSYKLKSNYEKKKEIHYIKRFSIFNFLPPKLINFLKLNKGMKTLRCGSTLTVKGGKPWETKLVLDKL